MPPPPEPERTFSLTISPIHLLFPIVEVTGELRVGPKVGIAALGGAGRLRAVTSSGDVDIESGSQFQGTTGAADGLAVGPFIGYKWVGRSGFTFDGSSAAGRSS